MSTQTGDNLTELLRTLRYGDKSAESNLIPVLYDELHAIACRLMRHERADHTLQPTALVGEAYIRLMAGQETNWKNRAHFFGVAAQVMRHFLVDYARARLTGKRGAESVRVTLDDALIVDPSRLGELLELEEALTRLEAEDSRALQVVVCRFYGGLSIDEIAEVLQVSPRTVTREWNFGRAWLKAELSTRRHGRKK